MRTLVVVFALLLAASVLTGSQPVSADVFPTIGLDFDPSTYTYVYTVQCPANSTYPFGEFQVDTKLAWQQNWQISGPWVPNTGSSSASWTQGFSKISTTSVTHYAFWKASEAQQIPENTAWVGQFVLVVPNSYPTMGTVLTKNGLPGSLNVVSMNVPGPVPEPSSMAVLGTGLLGLAVFWVRRR